jgi:CRISPR-associated endonuclease/helicase Cas3
LSSLAVYLIAAHHGKVRTVLRATARRDAVFGIAEEEVFPGWKEFISKPLTLPTTARRFGAEGVWSADGKTFAPRWPRCTSWASLVAELLGDLPASGGSGTPAASPGHDTGPGPKNPGPLRLAYLEAILRAADAQASARAGRGTSR